MDHTTIAKVTTSGQVSLPAAVRRRWRAARVVIEDHGDAVMVRPLPSDPIAAACGSLRRHGPATEAVRRSERQAAALRDGRPKR